MSRSIKKMVKVNLTEKYIEENDLDECYFDEPMEVEFPARWKVCPDCAGSGSTYLGWAASEQPSFSSEDFEREGADFYEDYVGGAYDRECPRCKGRTTVAVIDRDAVMRGKDKKLKALLKMHEEDEREESRYRSICEMERRFGC